NAAKKLRANAPLSGPLPRTAASVGTQSVSIPRRHQIQPIAGEPDDFGLDTRTVSGDHIATVTDRGLTAHRFEGETDHARQGPFDRRGGRRLCPLPASFEALAPGGTSRSSEVGRAHGTRSSPR